MKEHLKQHWFFYLIIIQPFLDIIAFFQQDNVIGSLAGYSRLLIMCVLPLIVLWKTPRKKTFLAFLAVIGAFAAAHVCNSYRVGYISIFQDVAYMARVMVMPITAISFVYLIQSDDYAEMTKKGFYVNLLVIFISIVIAYASGTAEDTYGIYGYGLKGWFANANSQSIIIMSIIPLAIEYANTRKNNWLFLMTVLISWFLLISNGTKVGYLSIFVIFGGSCGYYLLVHLLKIQRMDRKRTLTVLLYTALMAVSLIAYPLTPRYGMAHLYDTGRTEEQKHIDEDLKEIEKDHLTLDDLFADPAVKQRIITYYTPLLNQEMVQRFGTERILREYGYLPTAWIMSDVRKLKRMNSAMIWEDSDTLTRLVGFEYTNVHNPDGDGFDLENDYPAILYYYGYIGFGLYIAFLAWFGLMILKRILKDFKGALTPLNFALLITFLLQLGSAEYSGAILRRPNASVYMSILLALIYYQCHEKKAGEHNV